MKKPYCTIIDSGSGSSVNDLCAQNDVMIDYDIIIFYDFCNFLTVFLLQSSFKCCIALIIKQTSDALNIVNNKLVFGISSNNFRIHWSVANNNTKTNTSKSKLSNEIQAIKSYYATLCKVARKRKSVLSKFCKSSWTMLFTISLICLWTVRCFDCCYRCFSKTLGMKSMQYMEKIYSSQWKNLVTVCTSKAFAGCQHF